MSPLLFTLGIVVLLIVVPLIVGFTLWCNDRKNEERRGYWDAE